MKLIIAEKPSVALTLAEALEPNSFKKEKGCIIGNKYTYSWAIGHLVQLSDAKSYCSDPWNLKNIPIVPESFLLTPKQNTVSQFNILKRLINKSSEIINATDAGREGELIFRYIIDLIGNSPNSIYRLWLSSYTKESIVNGFNNLSDSAKYNNLYLAGKARNQADWLFGINATITLTKVLNNGNLYSLGRVQTPTFKLICERFIENKSFKPKQFFVPNITLEYSNIKFNAVYQYEDYILEKNRSENLLSSLGNEISCLNSSSKTKKEKGPLCYDLTSLQIEANNKFGYTADQTLSIAQSLYEKEKAITYPRTDSKYLDESQSNEVINLIDNFKALFPKINEYILFQEQLKSSKVFNSSKVSDHHAIIPTNAVAASKAWNVEKSNIYNLILYRFFKAFSKDAISNTITYIFSNNGEDLYKSSEKVYSFVGWKYFENFQVSQNTIPVDIVEGQIISILNKEITSSQTKPKPLYTEASLLSAMEKAGKEFDSEELPLEIKRKGIGTPATRASIIETLLRRKYISRNKKYLIPTQNGYSLYEIIKNLVLANVQLTGEWEESLFKIEEGTLSFDDFMNNVKSDLTRIVVPEIINLKTLASSIPGNSKLNIKAPCPKCKSSLSERSKSISCSNCDFIFWKQSYGKSFNSKEISNLLQGKITKVKGLKSKKNKTSYTANLKLDPSQNFKLTIESF